MKRNITLLAICCLAISAAFGQYEKSIADIGILPFTGAKFQGHGISGEALELNLDDNTWTSNRLPINTDFEIKLKKPRGLTIDENNLIFPGVEVLILKANKDTLGYVENIFGSQGEEGIDNEILTSLTLTLKFNELSKPGDSCLILVKFFDTKSSNYFFVDLQVVIADPSLPLENTNSTYSFRSTDGILGIGSGVGLQKVEFIIDEEQKLAELSMPDLEEVTKKELSEGSIVVWSYNEQLSMRILKGSEVFYMNGELPKIAVRVPLLSAERYMRFRWVSKDNTKVLDIVAKFLE